MRIKGKYINQIKARLFGFVSKPIISYLILHPHTDKENVKDVKEYTVHSYRMAETEGTDHTSKNTIFKKRLINTFCKKNRIIK